ncbi:MAG: hypothetical protein IJT01_04250, partial [Selenomonadaceae bacterium]|nr:hypothetical protein [Selenomonadaceae bacterium]
EVQKKAEQAQSALAGSQMSNSDAGRALRGEGSTQAVADAQQMAAATADASANAQTLSIGVQRAGDAAQQTSGYMEQINKIMEQMPANVQAGTQQVPSQTQEIFQQLPPIAQKGTDGIAQEWSQLAAKCQPGGEAFVQAANQWGQQAYEAIANWSSQMAQVVVDKLSSAWAQISSQFSAGLNVNVTTSGASVAHNATGGIYGRGAFLTTFAENSAEAAIPLDGSNRALSLWQQAGEMLGVSPVPSVAPVSSGGAGSVSIEYHGSPITINGDADSGTVEEIRAELERQKRDFNRMVERAMLQIKAEQGRLSYV